MDKIISAVSAQLNIGISSGTIEATAEQNHRVQLHWEFGGYFPDEFGATPSMRLAVDNRHIKSWQWENWISDVTISPKPEFLTEVERNLLREGSQNDELIERYATAMLLWDATQSDWKAVVIDEARAEVERVQREYEQNNEIADFPDPTGTGYLFAVSDDSEYYIPNALHIERDDSLMLYASDSAAGRAARIAGVPLIDNLDGVPEGVYLDTPRNRALITNWQIANGISQNTEQYTDMDALIYELDKLRDGDYGEITTINIDGHEVGIDWQVLPLDVSDYTAELIIDGERINTHQFSEFLRQSGSFDEYTEFSAIELETLRSGVYDERLQDIKTANQSVWNVYSGLWYDEVIERVEEELTERGIIQIKENETIQEGVQMDKTSLDFALNMLREGYFGRVTTANISGHNIGVEWSGTLLYGGDYSADLTIDGVVAAEYVWSDFLRYAGGFGEYTAAEGFKEYTDFSENELEAFREGVYGANLAAALDKNDEVWGKTSQQWRDEVMSLIEANLTERGIIPAIKSEVFAKYADMIESIMPLVDEGNPHTVFIISKAADLWTVEYPHLPDDVPVFVANTRQTDPLATSFTGAYFARGSYPYVYDKVLSIRLLAEYYEIKDSTTNLDTLAELHALAHFTDDVMSELSSETTDFLATLDKPLEWLAGINPYSLKSEAEYYYAPRDTPHKLIEIIEEKTAEAIEARDNKTPERRDYVWNVEIDKIYGQAKCRLWDSSDNLGTLVHFRTVNSTDRSVIEADIREFSPQGTTILYIGDETAKKQFTTRNLLALKMQIPTEYQQSVVNALEAGNPQAQRLIDLITEVHFSPEHPDSLIAQNREIDKLLGSVIGMKTELFGNLSGTAESGEVIAGYEIKRALDYDAGEGTEGFALAQSVNNPDLFATWQYLAHDDGSPRDYIFGHYFASAEKAIADFEIRAGEIPERIAAKEVVPPTLLEYITENPQEDIHLCNLDEDIDLATIVELNVNTLTEQGKADWADVLNARVESVYEGSYGHQMNLFGADAERISEFSLMLAGYCSSADYDKWVSPIDEGDPPELTIYAQTWETAMANGEQDEYRESMRLNKECISAIDSAIQANRKFDNEVAGVSYCDTKTAFDSVTAIFGAERVQYVVAAMLQGHGDGRISRKNTDWANTITVAEAKRYFGNTHQTILDGFADNVREAAELAKAPKEQQQEAPAKRKNRNADR